MNDRAIVCINQDVRNYFRLIQYSGNLLSICNLECISKLAHIFGYIYMLNKNSLAVKKCEANQKPQI